MPEETGFGEEAFTVRAHFNRVVSTQGISFSHQWLFFITIDRQEIVLVNPFTSFGNEEFNPCG